MGVTVTFTVKGQYLLGKSTGSVTTVDDIVEHARIVVNEIAKYQHKKLLLDITRVKRPKKLLYYYEAVQRFIKELPAIIRSLTVAIVISAEYEELGKFFETTAVNRGLHYHVFISMEEAQNWLASQ
jgi:hypothetical protein